MSEDDPYLKKVQEVQYEIERCFIAVGYMAMEREKYLGEIVIIILSAWLGHHLNGSQS